jgi:hypothetical protein
MMNFRDVKSVEDLIKKEEEPPKKKIRKYVIYGKNIEMNGNGIKYILNTEDDEKMSPNEGLEMIIEDLSSEFPDFYNEDYDIHLYIGNATYFTRDMMVDYNPDSTPDELIDKMTDWLDKNVGFAD